jgi:hypothetical protein
MPVVEVTPDPKTGSVDFKFIATRWDAVKAIVELIKGTIPVNQRSYNPDTKTWSVMDTSYPLCEKLFQTAGFRIEMRRPVSADGFFYEEAQAKGFGEKPSKSELENSLIRLLGINKSTLADDRELKKAYRRKALELHPDRNNGDGSKMSELNSIYNDYVSN